MFGERTDKSKRTDINGRCRELSAERSLLRKIDAAINFNEIYETAEYL